MVIGAPLAQARELGIDLKTLPKLNTGALIPERDFEAKTKKVVENSPYNESRISYEMRVPKEWTGNIQKPPIDTTAGGTSMLSGRVLGMIGRYVGAPVNLVRSYITVEAQKLTYEISAQNWFVNFILSNGFTLTALTQSGSRRVEALYVQVDGDQTYVVRTLVLLNGPDLIMVRYYLPQENYDVEYIQQEQVLKSFVLLNPVNEKIEKQAQYGFLDQSYFNYPESWTLKEKNILSVERMSALLYQGRKEGEGKRARLVLEGHIKIDVISKLLKTTLQQEIENFRKNLQIPSYSVGKMIEEITYDFDPSIKSGSAQIYRLEPDDQVNMQPYEYLVTVMEGEDYYYITSMITPSREEDFYLWAQNMEAAKIVNESMRRHNISLEYDPNDPYYDYMKEAQ